MSKHKKAAICPDCSNEMVKIYTECEDGSGYMKSWGCMSEQCQVTPEQEAELREWLREMGKP